MKYYNSQIKGTFGLAFPRHNLYPKGSHSYLSFGPTEIQLIKCLLQAIYLNKS